MNYQKRFGKHAFKDKSLLYEIARNKIADKHRRRKRIGREKYAVFKHPHEHDSACMARLECETILDSLSKQERDLLVCRYYRQMTYREISVCLGFSPAEVAFRTSIKGTKIMENSLEDEFECLIRIFREIDNDVHNLPLDKRQVICLFYVSHFSVHEIADVLDMSDAEVQLIVSEFMAELLSESWELKQLMAHRLSLQENGNKDKRLWSNVSQDSYVKAEHWLAMDIGLPEDTIKCACELLEAGILLTTPVASAGLRDKIINTLSIGNNAGSSQGCKLNLSILDKRRYKSSRKTNECGMGKQQTQQGCNVVEVDYSKGEKSVNASGISGKMH
ncbi:sigma factor-like helix-turn-helix DNA-binding protein [Planctomycetota bacterium]